MLSHAIGNSKPHIIKTEDIVGHLKTAEMMLAQATIERRIHKVMTTEGEKDFSLVDGPFRKTLAMAGDGSFVTYFKLCFVIDSPTIVYKGHDVAKAVDAYNDLL